MRSQKKNREPGTSEAEMTGKSARIAPIQPSETVSIVRLHSRVLCEAARGSEPEAGGDEDVHELHVAVLRRQDVHPVDAVLHPQAAGPDPAAERGFDVGVAGDVHA